MEADHTSICGQLRMDGGRVEVRMERLIEHDARRVWKMLTDSVYLSQWLAPGVIDPRKGGRVQLDFGNSGTPIDCRIRAFEPERLLSYSWSCGDHPERPLTWELEPCGQDPDQTRLRLTLSLPDDDLVSISCAGWDAHLEMLLAALEGISIHFPADRFRTARKVFAGLYERERAA